MPTRIDAYFDMLYRAGREAAATDRTGLSYPLDNAIEQMLQMAQATHRAGCKLIFIGNGGSAGIASHMAIDYGKNGGMRSLSFNDGAALTCIANDLGYEHVFSRQVEMLAEEGDLLIAISSSGRSENILRAVEAALGRNCTVITMSGFLADNPLRRLGALNFYVANSQYGIVEITHLALCHAVVDYAMGVDPGGLSTTSKIVGDSERNNHATRS